VTDDPFTLAFRFLSRRERTVTEMRRHLLHKGVEQNAVDEVIEELIDQRYLDDARYARAFAHDKRELEQWGSERIRRALLERGIDRDLVDETLAPHADEVENGKGGGELGRALALLRDRFPGPPRDRRERERALGVLLRKGYDPELALDALSGYSRHYR
jgi:regulatory protein